MVMDNQAYLGDNHDTVDDEKGPIVGRAVFANETAAAVSMMWIMRKAEKRSLTGRCSCPNMAGKEDRVYSGCSVPVGPLRATPTSS